jgi:hypothetical protein
VPDSCTKYGLFARTCALSASWNAVFERLYNGYHAAMQQTQPAKGRVVLRPAN